MESVDGVGQAASYLVVEFALEGEALLVNRFVATLPFEQLLLQSRQLLLQRLGSVSHVQISRYLTLFVASVHHVNGIKTCYTLDVPALNCDHKTTKLVLTKELMNEKPLSTLARDLAN